MNLLNRIFGVKATKDKSTLEDVMERAPYLAPWYFSRNMPKLLLKNSPLRWKNKLHASANILKDNKGKCYGVIGMYSYILPSDDNKSFLIWRLLGRGNQALSLFYYRCDDLKPFVSSKDAISMCNNMSLPFLFSEDPISEIHIEIDALKMPMKVDFPTEFKKFNDFIITASLRNLYKEEVNGNSALLEVKTTDGEILCFPQDWFNKGDYDFGYQWITRVIRDPATKLIHGQGIRLSNFVLDETNRFQKRSNVAE